MSNHLVAPSILAADFANLEREVKMINESQADWIHVDVMDGVFVPNFSLGIPVVEAHQTSCKKTIGCASDDREPRASRRSFSESRRRSYFRARGGV